MLVRVRPGAPILYFCSVRDASHRPATWCGLTLHDAEMKRIMSERDMRERISAIIPIPNDTPSIDEMRSYIQSGHVKWGAPVKQPGLEGSQQNAPAHAEPAASAVEPSKPAPQRKVSKGPAPQRPVGQRLAGPGPDGSR